MNNDNINNLSKAKKRLINLFDNNSFNELDKYQNSEVITAYGYINSRLVYAFSQDISVNDGAISVLHCKKIIKLLNLAIKTGNPVICIFDSNGININENFDVLNLYGEILKLINNISGVVPVLSLVLGTCAGCSSLIASSSDIIIMSKNAEFFLTPPSISEISNIKNLEIGKHEFVSKSGTVHIVEKDDISCINKARDLISILPQNNLSTCPISEYIDVDNSLISQLDNNNIDSINLINSIFDKNSVHFLSSDFSKSVVTCFATIQGKTVGVISFDKKNGYIDENSCSKAATFIRFCDAFCIPIITFVDTLGFSQNANHELNGIIKKASNLSNAYSDATTIKICIITGEAFGSAYITLASKTSNADITLAWTDACISALKPETAIEFLWHDQLKNCNNLNEKRGQLITKYKNEVASPLQLTKDGYIDEVIDKIDTRIKLVSILDMLSGKRVTKLPKKHSNYNF